MRPCAHQGLGVYRHMYMYTYASAKSWNLKVACSTDTIIQVRIGRRQVCCTHTINHASRIWHEPTLYAIEYYFHVHVLVKPCQSVVSGISALVV